MVDIFKVHFADIFKTWYIFSDCPPKKLNQYTYQHVPCMLTNQH